MSLVAGPYGLRIVKYLGDTPFSGGMHTYPMTANVASAFYFGDPVGLAVGQPTALAATPVPPATYGAAPTANNPIGVFMGCEYQDPKFGFVNAQFLPANAVNAGYTQIKLKIFDYPGIVMQIQADGPVPAGKIGMNAGIKAGTFANGIPSIGNSVVSLDSASVGAAAAAFRIYDYVYSPAAPGWSATPGDLFTDLLVTWCPGVHRFQIATGL